MCSCTIQKVIYLHILSTPSPSYKQVFNTLSSFINTVLLTFALGGYFSTIFTLVNYVGKF